MELKLRSLDSLITDLKIVSGQPANRKNRRARVALSRRIVRRLMKRAKRGSK